MPHIDFRIKRPSDFYPISDQILQETIIPQFERIVKKHAGNIAIKSGDISITYYELNNAINHVSNLILQTIGENKSPVSFLFEDELFSIVSIFAIIKSNKPIVGLHPSNSEEQLASFLNDANSSLLITSTNLRHIAQKITSNKNNILFIDELRFDIPTSAPIYNTASNDVFGIFYTSGSTGKPKGVISGHLNKSQSALYMNNEWYFSPSDKITLLTSVCFGAAYPSVMGALLSGATLCMFNLKKNTSQQAFNWIENEGITVFRSTPSIFRAIFGLAKTEIIFPKIRFITLGGEPVSSADIQLFKTHTVKDCVLINNYASTETGSICHYPVYHDILEFQGFLPAGFPAPGKEVLLLDDNGEIINNEQEGEIAVRSIYLSPGYWKQPNLTAQKFRQGSKDPNFSIYFTGDFGRWRKDGALEVVGRKDTQVKIRGYRIQLEAIDIATRNLKQIKDAATIVHKNKYRGEKLVVYFSSSNAEKISISQLKNDLAQHLPSYMLPSVFIQLDTLPRTATGKLSRLNLPEPSRMRPELTTIYVAPQTEDEIRIVNIWKNLLELETVGTQDNFFELGGDSLLALEMTLEVEKTVSKVIPQIFFANPTIAHLIELFSSNEKSFETQKYFQVESYKDTYETEDEEEIPFSNPLQKTNIRKIIKTVSSIKDFLVGKYISTLTYPKAIQWSVAWSNNSIVQKLFYKKQFDFFSKLIKELDCKDDAVNNFYLNILNNLHFKIPRHKENHIKGKRAGSTIQAYKNSNYLYWNSLGEILDSIPIGQVSEYFPIQGVEYLRDAYQKGKGVILLTFHGTPKDGRFFALEKILNLEKIETISYHTPANQSIYKHKQNRIPETAAFTLNAEIALYAQRLLQQGKIINIVSDTNDLQGKTYKTTIARREYQIKGGFAELALNTGATIIPHHRYCLHDGKILLNLLPPLQVLIQNGTREEQVENLINQYATFIESVWVKHPEALNWHRAKTHLKRPKVQ